MLKPILQSGQYLLRLVASRVNEDRCVQVAGNLTFTTLLALVPLFTIAFTLFTAFPVFDDWSNAFKVFLLTTLVPEVGGKVITVYMQQFADNAARLTAIGLVFLVITALMLMVSIERVFNSIWRAHRPRSVAQRVVIYWATLTIGPLLIGASLSITSWLVTQSMGLAGHEKGGQGFSLRVLPVLLNASAFALLYVVIPNRRVLIRDALVGGVAAALAFELMKRGFALYVELFPTYDLIYGTFATLPIFLLWIYLSWIVVLFGAVVTAVLPRWRLGALAGHSQGESAIFRALRLIEVLHHEYRQAGTPSSARLMSLSGLAEDDVEHLLGRMESAKWVRRVQPAGWVLARDLETLRIGDVYRMFVLRVAVQDELGGPLLRAAERLLLRVESELDVSLKALLEGEAGAGAESQVVGKHS
jgi:membrane protein